MKNGIKFFVGFSLLILLACNGCSENYQVEMDQAQKAMDQGKSIRTEDFASSNWKEAMQTWDQAQTAVKAGKPAKTFFIRAKSRFEKANTIAKANRDVYAKDVSEMQLTINTRFEKIKTALDGDKLNQKAKNQLKPLAIDLEKGISSLADLVTQGDFLNAKTAAKELQTKVYNAELVMAGKKPIS
jgi:hypothetical protein